MDATSKRSPLETLLFVALTSLLGGWGWLLSASFLLMGFFIVSVMGWHWPFGTSAFALVGLPVGGWFEFRFAPLPALNKNKNKNKNKNINLKP